MLDELDTYVRARLKRGGKAQEAQPDDADTHQLVRRLDADVEEVPIDELQQHDGEQDYDEHADDQSKQALDHASACSDVCQHRWRRV